MKAGQLLSFVVEALPEPRSSRSRSSTATPRRCRPTWRRQVVRDAFGRDPEHVFLDWQRAARGRREHRAGAPCRHARRARGRGEGAVPRCRGGDRGRPRQRRPAVPHGGAFTLKGLDTRRSSTSSARGCATSSTTASRPPTSTELAARSPATRSCTCPAGPRDCTPADRAHHRVDRRPVVGWSSSRRRRPRRSTAPARASGGSRSTRSCASACSTATRTPATTGSRHDGDVTFLDFGLVKRWAPGEWEQLAPSMDAIIVHRDPSVAAGDGGVGVPARRSRPRPAGRLRLREQPVSAVPDRPLHGSPASSCATPSQRLIDVNGPHAAGDRARSTCHRRS
jgi:hypothetical protein